MADITDLAEDLETLRRAKAEQQKWKDVADAAEEKIKNRLGEDEVGTIDGHEAVTWKTVVSNRVDTEKLKTVLGDDYRLVTKPSVSRRFTIKDD